MSGFLYGVILQWKLDIRSKSLLITCYAVPLLFYFVMGGIFTSLMPDTHHTLIQSMTVLGVSMGAFIGLPPSLVEIYGSDIKRMYKANNVSLYYGLISIYLSTFIHLFIMSFIIYITAPIIFDASLPTNVPLYFCSLALFIVISLVIGSILGLAVKDQAKLTMLSQIVFLPSIMLTGIMFPANLLPSIFKILANVLPATWGYKIMVGNEPYMDSLWPMAIIFIVGTIVCRLLLSRLKSE